jgi:hypothetical protein
MSWFRVVVCRVVTRGAMPRWPGCGSWFRPVTRSWASIWADEKPAIVLTDRDSQALARMRLKAKAWRLGPLLEWGRERARKYGFVDVTVGCESTGHRWRVLDQPCRPTGHEFGVYAAATEVGRVSSDALGVGAIQSQASRQATQRARRFCRPNDSPPRTRCPSFSRTASPGRSTSLAYFERATFSANTDGAK